jgi:regulator of protease activity HflC (stomatin/prohibitin superfamily)
LLPSFFDILFLYIIILVTKRKYYRRRKIMFLIIFAVILFIGAVAGLGFRMERVPQMKEERRLNESGTGYVKVMVESGYTNDKLVWKPRKLQLLSPLAFIFILFGMFTTVNANEVGIVYDPFNGGLQQESFDEGLHVKAPWIKVTKISTKLRESSFEVYAQTGQIYDNNGNPTGGGQWATYDVTLQYRVVVTDAFTFYKTFGSNEIPESTLEARIRESLQNTSTDYDVFSILKGSLNDVRLDTEEDLRESLAELGVYVTSFIIRDVDAGPEIEGVVEDEATAAKQKEIAIKEQEAALIREETLKLQAEIQAEKLIIQATAEAEAAALLKSVTVNAINTMYLGQFDDDAEKLAFETSGTGGFLTIQEVADIVIEQLFYDTWDGILPEVLAGEDGLSIILPSE